MWNYFWEIIIFFVSACIWKYVTGLVRQSQNARAPTAEPRRLGLHQVYPLQDNDSIQTQIDIVAIHGLHTHSPKTWVSWKKDGDPQSGQVHWLRDSDMLPSKIPNARIFTYDWNANFDQDASAQGLLGHADALLEKLHIHRSDEGEFHRPIVFVASCFGGLLLCRALHRASEEHSRYNKILKSTVGVAFLGTPFQGSHQGFVTAAQLRLNVAIASGGETASELVKYLSNNDHKRRQLDEVIQQFCEMVSRNRFRFPIRCFYETRKTDFKKVLRNLSPEFRKELGNNDAGILVPEHSACLQGQERSALDVRHGMLNKFAGPSDEAFKTVSFYLKEFVQEALQKSPDAWIRENRYTKDRLRIERLSGETLWMDQCYINLAIVQQPERHGLDSKKDSKNMIGSQSSPFSLRARLKVEQLDHNKHIELGKIFDLCKSANYHSTQSRRILIRGQAGVGKSTLCKRIVYDFLAGMWSDLFDRVLWVPLRRLKVLPLHEYSLEELFHHEYFHQTDKNDHLARKLCEIVKTGKEGTLFILDGWDEVAKDMWSSSNMPRLLKSLLNQPNVIITSRPSGTLPPEIDALHLELEAVGFYPNQVHQYIEKIFVGDQQKLDEIHSFLGRHALMQSLVRIPIQLDALCYIWDEDSTFGHVAETMTSVYQAIEERLWKKDIVRLGKKGEVDVSETLPSEIRRSIKIETQLLEVVAFSGLHGDIIEFSPSYLDAISEIIGPFDADFSIRSTLKTISFLRTSDPIAKIGHQSYHFLHLTFQEYFAARYFVQRWTNGENIELVVLEGKRFKTIQQTPIAFLQDHKYDTRYDIFWRFAAGLQSTNSHEAQLSSFFRVIEDEPYDLLGPKHQRLVMHCLSEISRSQEAPEFKQLRDHMEDRMKQWLLFECKEGFKSYLASEMEFPDHILVTILAEGSEHVQQCVLRGISSRPNLAKTIIDCLLSLLGGSVSNLVEFTVLEILNRPTALSKEVVQAIAAMLPNLDRYNQFYALEVLIETGPLSSEQNLRTIIAQVTGLNRDIESLSTTALEPRIMSSEELFDDVSALLQEPSRGIQSRAMDILGRLNQPLYETILEAVTVRLQDPDENIRVSASRILQNQRILPDGILETLAAQLQHPDEDIRASAAEILGSLRRLPDGILETLAAQLQHPDEDIRVAAAQILGSLRRLPDGILETLAARLQHPDKDVRLRAVRTLMYQERLPDDILETLAAQLQHQDKDVRLRAVRTLRYQERLPDDILETLAAKLQHQDKDIRFSAAQILRSQKELPNNILETLAAQLQDPDLGPDLQSVVIDAIPPEDGLPNHIVEAIAAQIGVITTLSQSSAIIALERQAKLPDNILQAIITKLPILDGNTRSWIILRIIKQSSVLYNELCSILLSLDDPSFEETYSSLLVESFRDDISWHVESISANNSSMEQNRNAQIHALKIRIERVRSELGLPCFNKLQ